MEVWRSHWKSEMFFLVLMVPSPGRQTRRQWATPKRWREAPAEDNTKEEAVDGTAGAGRLFGTLVATEDGED